MKKGLAIRLLGGDMSKAAKVLGCSKQAVQKWPVDDYDNIMSRRVSDSVIAALVRLNAQLREEDREGGRPPLDEADLADMVHVPAEATE